MIKESQELLKRMDRIVQAESRQKLLDEIDQFLEETGLDEEARRINALDQISRFFIPILQHLTLIYAYRQEDPSNTNMPHWRHELHNLCDQVVRERERMEMEIENRYVEEALTKELKRRSTLPYVRRQLREYPSFVQRIFESFKDSNSPFSSFVFQFIKDLAACLNERDVEKLMVVLS